MKKSIIMIVMTILSLGGFAQEKMVSVPESQLTEQQKAELSKQQVTQTLETASKWVGLGKEVGEAINGGLMALTHNADTLSQTKVGKFTMFMIAWKVMGTDVIQLVVGSVVFIIIITISMFYYFQNIRKKKYYEREYFEDGKIKKESVRFDECEDAEKVVWMIFTMIAISLNMAIIFA